jgi:phospholipase C
MASLSRRDFLKTAALIAAGATFPASVRRAFAINPEPGSTYLDAEHVVILMQENRSFDHAFGSLRGVRGFNDPRAMTLPGGNPVWLQTNAAGETYRPFRLDIKNTKITWMGYLPHSRASQVLARNEGKHDRWLDAKHSPNKEFAGLPLTMGHYAREDIPFYYALADAFTICDQNFSSALTSTTPNRLYLWSGKCRPDASMASTVHIANNQADYLHPVSWTTFPERLESLGISWKVYQNELFLPTGLPAEETKWLSNYGLNPLENFTQYNVRFSATHRRYLEHQVATLPGEIAVLRTQPPDPELARTIAAQEKELAEARSDLQQWTAAAYAALTPEQRRMHERAFCDNAADPDYRSLAVESYRDGGVEHQTSVPKGDLLHQFRQDVRTGQLPTVSWLTPPERFSDHPSSPWYGAWYLSEVFDILTRNPEVWKKTIFILCYDENDGYFDHVPPFMAPHPLRPGTGRVSPGIDTAAEQMSPEQDEAFRREHQANSADAIGLGYRVPLVIASPWSRGGQVCSQVFDQTSILQMLETFLSRRTGRPLREENITSWRRAVCGDLSAVFRPYSGEKMSFPQSLERSAVIDSISRAQFRPVPSDFQALTAAEIEEARRHPESAVGRSRQEPGTRPACALPYELAVDGALDEARAALVLRFSAGNQRFGAQSAGSPFRVYAPGAVRSIRRTLEEGRVWDYAVRAGDAISDSWTLTDFAESRYRLDVQGPNGFYRGFLGAADDPLIGISLEANQSLILQNQESQATLSVRIDDLRYGKGSKMVVVSPSQTVSLAVDWACQSGWHELRVRVLGHEGYERSYAGHFEDGSPSESDPAMAAAI